MVNDKWLPLTDYASKYHISISTLRRRIKSNEIQHRLESGRYMVIDLPPEEAAPVSEQKVSALGPVEPVPLRGQLAEDIQNAEPATPAMEESPVAAANRLLTELKKAYSNILHDKEEQIIQLKAEIADLKTLVRVLEEDNDRMKFVIQQLRR